MQLYRQPLDNIWFSNKWLRSSSGPKQIKNQDDSFNELGPIWPWVLSYVNRIAVDDPEMILVNKMKIA